MTISGKARSISMKRFAPDAADGRRHVARGKEAEGQATKKPKMVEKIAMLIVLIISSKYSGM